MQSDQKLQSGTAAAVAEINSSAAEPESRNASEARPNERPRRVARPSVRTTRPDFVSPNFKRTRTGAAAGGARGRGGRTTQKQMRPSESLSSLDDSVDSELPLSRELSAVEGTLSSASSNRATSDPPRRGRHTSINAGARVTGESARDPTVKALQSLRSPFETHLRTLVTSEEACIGSAARNSVSLSTVRNNSRMSALPTTNITYSGNLSMLLLLIFFDTGK